MKTFILSLGLIFMNACLMFAQDVTGKWKTIDDETGKEKSIVKIYKENGKLYGQVVEILNPDRRNAKCVECPGADKGKPVKGLVIIKGLEKDGDEYSGGKILDPETGKLYKALVSLESPDKLKVRGYIGFSLLGRTQYWKRVE